MDRQARAGPSSSNAPIARRTRAAMRLAAAVEADGPPKHGLADHRNVLPPKNVEKKVLLTKQETQKLAEEVAVEAKAKGEGNDGNDRTTDDPAISAFSSSRFDDVVLYCSHYSDDINDYMFYIEQKDLLQEDFLHGLKVGWRMRGVLIDWLVQVQERFRLLPETLYGTVNILDRYLSLGLAEKGDLQLVGVTCMVISAKYEEIFPPELLDFVYITENSVTKKDIIREEMKVLTALNAKLGRPCALQFLRRLTTHLNMAVHSLAKYINELAVCDYTTCHLRPSLIAAVSVWIAIILKEFALPPDFFRTARVPVETARGFLSTFARVILRDQRNNKLVAIRSKFTTLKNHRSAVFSPEQLAELENISKNSKPTARFTSRPSS